jgi:hypothetical protein
MSIFLFDSQFDSHPKVAYFSFDCGVLPVTKEKSLKLIKTLLFRSYQKDYEYLNSSSKRLAASVTNGCMTCV